MSLTYGRLFVSANEPMGPNLTVNRTCAKSRAGRLLLRYALQGSIL